MQQPGAPGSLGGGTGAPAADAATLNTPRAAEFGELPSRSVYRVVSEAKVRAGVERTSPMVRLLTAGMKVEVLADRPDSTGQLRCGIVAAGGWQRARHSART